MLEDIRLPVSGSHLEGGSSDAIRFEQNYAHNECLSVYILAVSLSIELWIYLSHMLK
jgi:hypothetical protein